MQIAQRMQAVKPSATLEISALAKELKAKGRDIISLGTGEPDFDTPEHVKDAALEAMRAGHTKYTAVDGTPELKAAVLAKFARDNDLHYEPNQICISCGAKQSCYNLFQAVLNPGDEVIIPAPYWVSYPDMAALAGAIPVIVASDIHQGFKITPQQLQQAISNKTRMLILNSPSNPSGSLYSRQDLEALAEVLIEHPQTRILSDDIYEHIRLHPGPFSNIANVCDELKQRTVVLNGVSKAYAMTGWRIGYAAADADTIRAIKTVQGQSTSNPCSISQAAARAALEGDQSCIHAMLEAFRRRHDAAIATLQRMELIRTLPAAGAFYLFCDISAAVAHKGYHDDAAFVMALLNQQGVACVPGSAFGMPGHLRISFATSETLLAEALRRLQHFLTA